MMVLSGLHYPIEIDLNELAGRRDWHPGDLELFGYIHGVVDELDRDCIRFHLDECRSCSARLEVLESGNKVFAKRSHAIEEWKQETHSADLRSNRWQMPGAYAAAAVILIVCLISWVILITKTKASHSASVQSSVPDVETLIKSGGQDALSPEPENHLLAESLEMPEVIAGLDRTATLAVRGTRPSADTFAIIGPVATIVSNDRPVFRWTELEGVESYTVSVYDADLQLATKSEPLKEPEWVIPIRLRPEVTYTWIVAALKESEERLAPAPPSRAEFRIIGKRAHSKLKYELAQANSPGARGVLFAKAGMLDESERELSLQVRLTPHDQRSRNLLATVRSWRRESKP